MAGQQLQISVTAREPAFADTGALRSLELPALAVIAAGGVEIRLVRVLCARQADRGTSIRVEMPCKKAVRQSWQRTCRTVDARQARNRRFSDGKVASAQAKHCGHQRKLTHARRTRGAFDSLHSRRAATRCTRCAYTFTSASKPSQCTTADMLWSHARCCSDRSRTACSATRPRQRPQCPNRTRDTIRPSLDLHSMLFIQLRCCCSKHTPL